MLKYVGFFTLKKAFSTEECVLGEGENGFYYGPFAQPSLNNLFEYYFDPAESLAEFERLNEVKVYQKDLVEECKRVLDSLKYEAIDGRCVSKFILYHRDGDLEFTTDITDRVNELKEFINNG
jgi:hypothetical protein